MSDRITRGMVASGSNLHNGSPKKRKRGPQKISNDPKAKRVKFLETEENTRDQYSSDDDGFIVGLSKKNQSKKVPLKARAVSSSDTTSHVSEKRKKGSKTQTNDLNAEPVNLFEIEESSTPNSISNETSTTQDTVLHAGVSEKRKKGSKTATYDSNAEPVNIFEIEKSSTPNSISNEPSTSRNQSCVGLLKDVNENRLLEYSFGSTASENEGASSVSLLSTENDEHNISTENAIAENHECKRNRFTWVSTYWTDLKEVQEFLASEGFTEYDKKELDIGLKIYYRCKEVPKRSKVWCDRRYILYFPSDITEIVLMNNSRDHTHDQIVPEKSTKKLTDEMVNFMNCLYGDKTTTYESVIRHINRARSTQNIFQDEKNPSYRQHEYRLSLYRNSHTKQVVRVGDIAAYCEENFQFPTSVDEPFVLNCETSNVRENLYFRFCVTTPYLLEIFASLEMICIDATYKLNWNGYPLVVLGTVDRAKRFHPLLYGCTSNETADDYAFMFRSVKESVEKYFEKSFNPKIMVADGARAISNAFFQVFSSAEMNIMCYAHVIRNCRKRPFTSQINKKLILEDIGFVHLAPNREKFDMMSKLFLEKWRSIEENFIEYFEKEWLGDHKNWFEGAAVFVPSHNNGVESHNSNIKRNYTMRKRLPLNQFFDAVNEMVIAASKKLSNGDRQITSEPTASKKIMMRGVELEVSGLKPFKAKDNGEKDVIVFLVPSEDCTSRTRNHYKYLEQKQWVSFDEYIQEGFNQFYIVHLSKSNWKCSSKCSCPSFFKQNICKHVIALAIREKVYKVPSSLNPQTLANHKKKPGRPRAAAKALVSQ